MIEESDSKSDNEFTKNGSVDGFHIIDSSSTFECAEEEQEMCSSSDDYERSEMCPSFAILHGIYESDINAKAQCVEVVNDNHYAYTSFSQKPPIEELFRREVFSLCGAPYRPQLECNNSDYLSDCLNIPSAQSAQYKMTKTRREGMNAWSSRETDEMNNLLRGLKWRSYLGCLGGDCRLWAAEVTKQRTEYSRWRSKYLFDPSNKRTGSPAPSPSLAPAHSIHSHQIPELPLCLSPTERRDNEGEKVENMANAQSGNECEKDEKALEDLAYMEHAELQKEINEDVVRTYSDQEFFARQDTRDIMNRILMVYSRRHTDLSYVQGMNEVLAPIVYALSKDYEKVHMLTAEESIVDPSTLTDTPIASLTVDDVLAIISEVIRVDYIEHDAYWLFTCLMRVIGPWFNSPKHPVQQQPSLSQPHQQVPPPAAQLSPQKHPLVQHSLSQKPSPQNSFSPKPSSADVSPFSSASVSPPEHSDTKRSDSKVDEESSANKDEIEVVLKCREIQRLLAEKDPELERSLEELGIQPQLYMLRWVRILFSQVFPLDDLLYIWDAIFACGAPFNLVDHFCVTLLTLIRKSIIRRSYSNAMNALFHYPLDLFPTSMIISIALGSMRSGALPYYHEAYLPPPSGPLKFPDLIPDADLALSVRGTAQFPASSNIAIRGVVRRRVKSNSGARDKTQSRPPPNSDAQQFKDKDNSQSKIESLQNFLGGLLKKNPRQEHRKQPTQESVDELKKEVITLKYENFHYTTMCDQALCKLDKLSAMMNTIKGMVSDEAVQEVIQQAESEIDDIKKVVTAKVPQSLAPFPSEFNPFQASGSTSSSPPQQQISLSFTETSEITPPLP